MDIKKGFYRHFKGNIYEVIGIAVHSETQEEMVVYVSNEKKMWIRPLENFSSKVFFDGKEIPRFNYLGEKAFN